MVSGLYPVVALISSCWLVGCSDFVVPESATPDLLADAAAHAESATEAGPDASIEATPEAAPCASIDQYCATSLCVMNWSVAQSALAWCSRTGDLGGGDIVTHCSGFNVVFIGVGADSSLAFFYDPGSGNLVGVSSFEANPVCAAGQPPATSPDCTDAAVLSTFNCSNDASAFD